MKKQTINAADASEKMPMTLSISGLPDSRKAADVLRSLLRPEIAADIDVNLFKTSSAGVTTVRGYICCDFHKQKYYWCPGPGGVCSYLGEGCPA